MTIRTPLQFRADIYTKTIAFDEAGQSVETWSFDRTVKCHFQSLRQEERTVGRVQNPRSYWIWVEDYVDYSEQVRDLRDRFGNYVDQGQFNVIGVKRFPGWNSVHHYQINIQKILS